VTFWWRGHGPRRARRGAGSFPRVLSQKRGMPVEFSDSASCPELKRLRELFRDASAAFKQADEAVHQGVGVTHKEEYAALTDAWERTRLALETAATALESHQATHGCSSQRSPGILIHRGHGSGTA
jgi:hypothetical protein